MSAALARSRWGDGGASVLWEEAMSLHASHTSPTVGLSQLLGRGRLGGRGDDEVAAGLRHLGRRAPDDLVEGGALGASARQATVKSVRTEV